MTIENTETTETIEAVRPAARQLADAIALANRIRSDTKESAKIDNAVEAGRLIQRVHDMNDDLLVLLRAAVAGNED